MWLLLALTALTTALTIHTSVKAERQVSGHPRLYFTAEDLPRLRGLRQRGRHRLIWRNLRRSAEWCLEREPRLEWIAPVSPDPVYANLYDRFYAIMGDLAITEHLAFAYAFSGEERYGDAAREWTLASCRAWKREAEGQPDGSKAYAVSRLLKGVAVGYDIAWDRFTPSERDEVRDTLALIARKYYEGYFNTPGISGPGFHTHHAIVEYGSFGVAALALLGEVPEARTWVEATARKFEDHLLPHGLAPDGAQTEGSTFWASTMHYRLFFMDALRHVTGRNLYAGHEKQMSADLALASIAARKPTGYNRAHETVVLSPPYGQLDYYAPALLALAREYRRPELQRLALWDESLGSLQQTRYITPNGEQLLFELGGYAYLWYDPSVPTKPAEEPRLSYRFPSRDEAYLRASWRPGDLLVGVRKGQVVVHAGGVPALIDSATPNLVIRSLRDEGGAAVIECDDGGQRSLLVELHRPNRLVIRRHDSQPWRWWCQGTPQREGNRVTWGKRVVLVVVKGRLDTWEPEGHAPRHAVGNGRLLLKDPAPRWFPLASIQPDGDGEIVVEITHRAR